MSRIRVVLSTSLLMSFYFWVDALFRGNSGMGYGITDLVKAYLIIFLVAFLTYLSGRSAKDDRFRSK